MKRFSISLTKATSTAQTTASDSASDTSAFKAPRLVRFPSRSLAKPSSRAENAHLLPAVPGSDADGEQSGVDKKGSVSRAIARGIIAEDLDLSGAGREALQLEQRSAHPDVRPPDHGFVEAQEAVRPVGKIDPADLKERLGVSRARGRFRREKGGRLRAKLARAEVDARPPRVPASVAVQRGPAGERDVAALQASSAPVLHLDAGQVEAAVEPTAHGNVERAQREVSRLVGNRPGDDASFDRGAHGHATAAPLEPGSCRLSEEAVHY